MNDFFLMLKILKEHKPIDVEIWDKLNENEKKYFYKQVKNKKLKNDFVEDQYNNFKQDKMDRLKLLEGLLHAGNYSKKIINEIQNILNHL